MIDLIEMTRKLQSQIAAKSGARVRDSFSRDAQIKAIRVQDNGDISILVRESSDKPRGVDVLI